MKKHVLFIQGAGKGAYKEDEKLAASLRQLMRSEVDEIVCAVTPRNFQGVGLWYGDFSQTSDQEVRELLKLATRQRQVAASPP